MKSIAVLVDINYLKHFREQEGLPPLTPSQLKQALLRHLPSGSDVDCWVAYDAAPAAVKHPDKQDFAQAREAEFQAYRDAGWEVRLGRCVMKTAYTPSGEAARTFDRRGVGILTALDLLTLDVDEFYLLTGDADLTPVVEEVTSLDDDDLAVTTRVTLLTDVAKCGQRLVDAASTVIDLLAV